MKTIELSEAVAPLSEYAERAERETLIVMKGGKPLAALTSVRGKDLQTLARSDDRKLASILERSRKSIREKGGFTTDEVRRMFNIPKEKRPKRARKTVSLPGNRKTA